jgi:hypothetical protein
VTKPVGSPIRIGWRARVGIEGAEFRIYRGRDLAHLQQVGRMAADVGEKRYRFRDTHAASEDAVYEVRFVDEAGRERVVARAFCERATNLGSGMRTETATASNAILPVAGVETPPTTRLAWTARDGHLTRPPQRPLTPPPRRAAV